VNDVALLLMAAAACGCRMGGNTVPRWALGVVVACGWCGLLWWYLGIDETLGRLNGVDEGGATIHGSSIS
jgi:hypothetical protein